jgi:hypothetical protein
MSEGGGTGIRGGGTGIEAGDVIAQACSSETGTAGTTTL